MYQRLLSFIVLALVCNIASGTPIQWKVSDGGNGHWYELVEDAIDWNAAKLAAEQSIHEGTVGHLATITSQAENDFILSSVYETGTYYTWVGGFQPAGSPEPDGNWQWLTGETWDFTNWNLGVEPNNFIYSQTPYGEDVIQMSPIGWYDAPHDWDMPYIVEYESVPEPTCFTLFVCIGLILRKR